MHDVKYIEVESVRTRYVAEGSGDPVVLIHGFPETLLGWRKNIPALAGHFRVLALDMVGFGRTEPAAWDFSCSGLALFVKKFLDALQIRTAHVVGTDTGASIAMGLAAYHPEKVRKLAVFSGTAYPGSVKALEVRMMMLPLIGDIGFPLLAGPGIRFSIRRGYHDPKKLDPEALKEYLDCLSSWRSRALAVKLMRELERTAGAPLAILKKSPPPTLILWAEHEKYFHSWVPRRLHEDIPGSRLEYIKDSGHFLQEEQPEKFNTALIDFLQIP